MGLFVPLSINDTHHNKSAIMLNVVYAEEYRVSFNVMLSVVMLNVVMHSVIMLIVMLSVVMLSVVMLSVIMLSVVMPNVVAPYKCRYLLQWVIQ